MMLFERSHWKQICTNLLRDVDGKLYLDEGRWTLKIPLIFVP